MTEKYYLDTSIWLDFFEDRDELNLPKSKWAHQLVNKIIKNDARILYSDINIVELEVAGYPSYDVGNLFKNLKPILIFVEATNKEIRGAKDLSLKRNVSKGDALHALIARDNKAIFVTLDRHFKKLGGVIEPKRPQNLI